MGGRDVTRESPATRDLTLVFQNFSLYPDWTVRRNLEFPLRAPGRGMKRPTLNALAGAQTDDRMHQLLVLAMQGDLVGQVADAPLGP